jgi:pilus assembly protein Flp/PilA
MNEENKDIVREEEETGASMVEYALIAALVAVVCIAAVTFLGQQASTTFSNIGSSVAGGNN